MAGAAQPERPDFLQYWHCRPQEQSGMPFLCKKNGKSFCTAAISPLSESGPWYMITTYEYSSLHFPGRGTGDGGTACCWGADMFPFPAFSEVPERRII